MEFDADLRQVSNHSILTVCLIPVKATSYKLAVAVEVISWCRHNKPKPDKRIGDYYLYIAINSINAVVFIC